MKTPKMKIKPPQAEPLPIVGQDVEDETMKELRRRQGFEKTILGGKLNPRQKKGTLG